MDLATGQRAERKLLLTFVEWGGTWEEGVYTGGERELLGARTEDSAIEFNPDIETTTDILGITYTDVNKTEPTQPFDPSYIIGGKKFAAWLGTAAIENDIQKYNNTVNVYVVTAYDTKTVGESTVYKTVRHKNCSAIPSSIGGSSYVSLPFDIHFSNDITKGTVDKLTEDFTFTE